MVAMKLACMYMVAMLALAGVSSAHRSLHQAGTGGPGGKGGKGGNATGDGAIAGSGGAGATGGKGGDNYNGGKAGNGGFGGEGGDGGSAVGLNAIAGDGGKGGIGGDGGTVYALPQVAVKSPTQTSIVKCITVSKTSTKIVKVTLLLPFTITIENKYTERYELPSLGGVTAKSFLPPVVVGSQKYVPCVFVVPVSVLKQTTLTLSGTIVIQATKTVTFKSTVTVCS